MNLAGGSRRSETEKHIKKPQLVHAVGKHCSSVKTISKNPLEKYSHIKPLSGKLHLSGGSVDFLLGTYFAGGFVQPEDIDHSKPEWYLPLQAVFTPDKSTKVRIVFDSSCEGHKGHSLPTRSQPNEENPILTHLLEKCSLISKIRRTLAYVNQFISYLKGNKLKGSIAVEDLQIARKQLFRISQCKYIYIYIQLYICIFIYIYSWIQPAWLADIICRKPERLIAKQAVKLGMLQ